MFDLLFVFWKILGGLVRLLSAATMARLGESPITATTSTRRHDHGRRNVDDQSTTPGFLSEGVSLGAMGDEESCCDSILGSNVNILMYGTSI